MNNALLNNENSSAVLTDNNKKTKERHYGIELLRIVSMVYIIILHIFGCGGIASASAIGTSCYNTSWIILALCYPAVNCYGLISGYVSCKSRFRFSKLAALWLTVVSLNAVIYLVFRFGFPELLLGYRYIKVFTPLYSNTSWYFVAYFGMYLFTPIINTALASLEKRTYTVMLVLLYSAYVVIPFISKQDIFFTHSGYSMLWIMILYITGAYFKLHVNFKNIKLWSILLSLTYLLSCAFMAIRKFATEGNMMYTGIQNPAFLEDYTYTSPACVIAGISLFCLFTFIKIKGKTAGKIILKISASTFGVYIIHTHPLIWNNVLFNRFMFLAQKPPVMLVAYAIVFAVCIFVICAFIDTVRSYIFKLIKIDKLLAKLPF